MREKEDRLLTLLGQLPDEMLQEAMTPSMVTDEVAKIAPGEGDQGTAPKAKCPMLWQRLGKRRCLLAACLSAVLLYVIIWDPAGWSLFGDKKDAIETEPPLTEASLTEASLTEASLTEAAVSGTTSAALSSTEASITETASGTLAPTEAMAETMTASATEKGVLEFWYRGIRYRFTGRVLTELPENAQPVSLLYLAEGQSAQSGDTQPGKTVPLEDWQTSCDALAGCQVYRILYHSEFLVEHEDGYGYYVAYAEMDRKGETEDGEKP